jgi:hypothetical protein
MLSRALGPLRGALVGLFVAVLLSDHPQKKHRHPGQRGEGFVRLWERKGSLHHQLNKDYAVSKKVLFLIVETVSINCSRSYLLSRFSHPSVEHQAPIEVILDDDFNRGGDGALIN